MFFFKSKLASIISFCVGGAIHHCLQTDSFHVILTTERRWKMNYTEIKNKRDIKEFFEKTNSLHDGHIISVQYFDDCTKSDRCSFESRNAILSIKVLVTSMPDTTVEIEFEDVLKWQIKNDCSEILDITLFFNEGFVVWADDIITDMEDIKNCSYVVARSMKWRIVD